MSRFLFIRDDGRNHGDVYPAVEDFLRNVRANPTDETWAKPINYRLPHRYERHHWKLVRNLPVTGTPRLAIIGKDADQFNLSEHFDLCVKELLDTVDANYAGAAFLVIFPVESAYYSSISDMTQSIRIATKNDDGLLVDAKTGEILTNGHVNELCLVLLSVFKMGNLPIYSMYLDNDLIINKVWFRNLNETNEIVVFAENIDLKTAVFSPTVISNDCVCMNNILLHKGNDIVIDMFGTTEWQGVIERQENGSEIILSEYDPPSLNGMIDILTDLKFTFDGRYITITPPIPRDRIGYLKIEIRAGIFFQDFGQELKWEWTIFHK